MEFKSADFRTRPIPVRQILFIGLVLAVASCASRARPPAPSHPASCPADAPAPPVEPVASSSTPVALPTTPAQPREPNRAPTAVLFDPGMDEAGFYPRGDALGAKIDGAVVDQILREAEETKSDSLIILQDGHTIVERYFGKKRGPIETMSVTKSIVAIAVVLLLEDGKIPSLDAPMSTWLKDFSTGEKAKITLRHLLTQSSGLEHDFESGTAQCRARSCEVRAKQTRQRRARQDVLLQQRGDAAAVRGHPLGGGKVG